MRKLILASALCVVGLTLPVVPHESSAASAQAIVTAAQVNGTWRSKYGEFKIWALGNQKLRVEVSATYEYTTPSGPMANTGEGSGIAHIEGDTATFKPDGAEDECKITMKFKGGKLIVTQESNCGFGLNVTADGAYKRISTRKPKFGA